MPHIKNRKNFLDIFLLSLFFNVAYFLKYVKTLKKSTNMKSTIDSIDIMKQPLVWRQFVAKHKLRGVNFLTIALDIYKKIIYKTKIFNVSFSRMYSPSFIFDLIIVGSNPIMTMLLLNKLEQVKTEKKIRVGLYIPLEMDYWAYDIIKDDEILKELSKILNTEILKIEDMITHISQKNFNNIEIISIDKRYKIDYFEQDEITKNFAIYFSKDKNELPIVADIIKYQNEVKNMLILKMMKDFYKNNAIKKLIWKHTAPKNDFVFYPPIAFSKNILLTSLPQGWMSAQYTIDKQDIVKYSHILSEFSFGTAKTICANMDIFKTHSARDIQLCDKLSIEEIIGGK